MINIENDIHVNDIYTFLLKKVYTKGNIIKTRQSEVYRNLFLPNIVFNATPLVTKKKTAYKKALEEFNWFLGGKQECPQNLQDWWYGQLNAEGKYLCGYGEQLRRFSYFDGEEYRFFDQISHLIETLRSHPYSRRNIISTWNSGEMANITRINQNPNTPTTCHNTVTQFFVEDGNLIVRTYQRSCDMILGVPHNWIQMWGFMLWICHMTGLNMGKLIWMFGDAHIYNHPSHIEVLDDILNKSCENKNLNLIYEPSSQEFDHNDFRLDGEIPEPVTKKRALLI